MLKFGIIYLITMELWNIKK